jgi:myo-inositol catabolism protein IolS
MKSCSEGFVFGGASISGEGKGYGFGPCSEKEAETLLCAAFEHGVRYFDTAPIYGYGLSEERIGRYLPPEARIITKGGIDWHPSGRVNLCNSPQTIVKMVEASLKRLGRSIFCYMIHWPDPRFPTAVALEVLLPYQNRGDILHLGLSNPDWDELPTLLSQFPIRYLQLEGNFLTPQIKERISFCRKLQNNLDGTKDLVLQSWGTLKKGILTGRVHSKRHYPPEDARSWAPWWKSMPLAELLVQARPLLEQARQQGRPPAHLAMEYNFKELGFDQVIVGPRSVTDLRELVNYFSDSSADVS